MAAFFSNVWDQICLFFSAINPFTSLLDIVLVALAIFSLIKFVQDSRAEQLIKGILVLGVVYLGAWLLDLKAVSFILEMLFENGLILIVLIFQPELRRMLERAGHSRFSARDFFNIGSEETAYLKRWEESVDAVCGAVELLQRQRMGALFVFERNTRIGNIIDTGTEINAVASAELMGNIFFNKAPLHDGAMVIRDGLICAAGCILPLTDNLQLSSELGTRHRAAVGMSENSDAVVVVVSEETGTISVAQSGGLTRDFTIEALRELLEREILEEYRRKNTKGKKRFWRWSK